MVAIPASLMQETVVVEPFSGASAYGPVYGDAVTYDPSAGTGCYVEPGFKRVVDRQGKEVISSALVIAPASPTMSPQDRVTWNGGTYQVIDAQPMRPGGAVHHQEVYLQSVGVS